MSSGSASSGSMTQQQPQQNGLQQSNGGGSLNGKKGPSGGSSGGPTPAGTPVQNGTGGQQGLSPPPLTSNAPKYGTLVPNRIFVGGISASTTEGELMQLFSNYGTVKAAKIIQDRAGVSKGYGFITFENEDDARRPLRDPDNIILRERRLNIAPAIKKQPFGRPSAAPPYDAQGQVDGRSSVPSTHQAALQPPMAPFFFGGAPQFYPGAYYPGPHVPTMVAASTAAQAQVTQASQDQAAAAAQQAAVYQAPPVYPGQTGPPQAGPYHSMMFPQAIYMPQQYPLVPYDYPVYSAGAGGPTANSGVPPHYTSVGPSSNGDGTSPSRGACYAPAPGPPDAALVYAGPPAHHIFHPTAIDTNTGAPGPMYASVDGTFDPMTSHAMAHFGQLPAPYGLEETYVERPDGSGTPRSYLTSTPPPSEQRSTATPVVSLLSLDYQQEKDPASMQGGRKPPPLNSNNVHLNQSPIQRRGGHQINGGGNGSGPRRPPQHRSFNNTPHIQHNMQVPPPVPFTQSLRRPRKPPRRSGTSGGASTEIGAGDAPLPNQDDVVLASQVETLKI
ncbi:hypothetical protein ABEB36_007044 [Hypothenemus hampei]|uniref:RRM domain-containing protein n=1 Tax=Hypothenemus hampei TaxID=57062 RepID=A0ABD1EVN5_HYPHA